MNFSITCGGATRHDLGEAAPRSGERPQRALDGPRTNFTVYRHGALDYVTDGHGGVVLEDPATGTRYALP